MDTLAAFILAALGAFCVLFSVYMAAGTVYQVCNWRSCITSRRDAVFLFFQPGGAVLCARWGLDMLRAAGLL